MAKKSKKSKNAAPASAHVPEPDPKPVAAAAGPLPLDLDSSAPESSSSPENKKNTSLVKSIVYIVILGELSMSPRMRNHAEMLAENGFLVQLIGYAGAKLPSDIENNPNIWIRAMRPVPEWFQEFPKLVSFCLKVIWQSIFLLWTLCTLILPIGFYPNYILVQNPPAIPTLPILWAFSRLTSSKLVIDWHNYGWSIMSLKSSPKSLIVRFAKWIEDYFGAKGDVHFCVTNGMREDLKERLGIDAITLYDRPPDRFKSLTTIEKEEFLEKISEKFPALKSKPAPKIIISCTSWTEDEDFKILLSALKEYDVCYPLLYLPELVVFITGKGPLKEYYSEIISNMKLSHVTIYLPWLEHEDFPKLLGSGDLGVCLHTSSSGLDLPMKVVDMFGAGLPVCAVNFKCIDELVKHQINGYVINNSKELAHILRSWFVGPVPPPETNEATKSKIRENISSFQNLRWRETWTIHAGPIFQ